MFEEPTVIVVGAGGSVDFGLPTGAAILTKLQRESSNQQIDSYNLGADLFKYDFHTFLRFNNLSSHLSAADVLCKKARNTFSSSIDMFAYNNEEITEVSKIYSAWKIMSGLYKPVHNGDPLYSTPSHIAPTYKWRSPLVDNKPTWLTYLVRKYTDGCKDVEDLKRNRLKIVTFNYDTIIEDALKVLIQSEQRYADIGDEALPKVYHVYGKFPNLRDILNSEDILTASKSISYMQETIDEGPEKNLTICNIQNAIHKAQFTYIFGFDMHDRNVELIKLADSNARKFALNFDGNPGLHSRLLKAGVEDEHIKNGTAESFMNIGKACEQGFFDLAYVHPKASPPKYDLYDSLSQPLIRLFHRARFQIKL